MDLLLRPCGANLFQRNTDGPNIDMNGVFRRAVSNGELQYMDYKSEGNEVARKSLKGVEGSDQPHPGSEII